MRVAIVGTSNSIGSRGYTRSLAANQRVKRFGNFSLGHSTSVALPFSLYRFNPEDYDFCIFDFAVNEEGMLRKVPERSEQIISRLELILERFNGTSCLPVFLIMPCQIGLEGECLGRDLYKKFATKHNLPYIDGYNYLEKIRNGTGLLNSELFRDADHIISWAAYALGTMIAEELSKIQNTTKSSIEAPISQFLYFNAAEENQNKNDEVVKRKTSLIEEKFFVLEGSDPREFNISRSGTLIGIGLDLASTNSRIELFTNTRKTILDFGMNYFDSTQKKVTFVIRPVFPPLPFDTGFSVRLLQRDTEERSIMHLNGFSLQFSPRPTNILNLSGASADLVNFFDQDKIDIATFAARSFLQK